MLTEPKGASTPKSENQNCWFIRQLIMITKIFLVRYQPEREEDEEETKLF